MMHGAFFLPCSNKSRTRDAPTPTNISTKSEPEIEKKGTFASPATALASNVLPVPGGPTIRTPFGILPPSFWNFCGSLRNSIISWSSSLASSTPATSLNVTRFCWLLSSFAFDLPKLRALFPPACIWRSVKARNPISNRNGNALISISQPRPLEAGSSVYLITALVPSLVLLNSSILSTSSFRVASLPSVVTNLFPAASVNSTPDCLIDASLKSLLVMRVMASLIANSCGAFCCLPCKYQTNRSAAEIIVSHKKTCLAFEFNLKPPNHSHPKRYHCKFFDEGRRYAVVLNAPH